MTQTIGIETFGGQDPAVIAWGEAFRDAPMGVSLREALNGLMNAVETAREVRNSIGHTVLAGVTKLAS
jgi:hypothetical protein